MTALADGVIVGSALVKELEEANPLKAKENFLQKAQMFVQAIKEDQASIIPPT